MKPPIFQLKFWMKRLSGGNHRLLAATLRLSRRIKHQEKGVIPMPRQAPDLSDRPHSRIVPLGLHSDTVKPSTGYCYPHAQVQARRQVEALFSYPGSHAIAARSRLSRWFDAVFIRFLEQHPQRALRDILAPFQASPQRCFDAFFERTKQNQPTTFESCWHYPRAPLSCRPCDMFGTLKPFSLFLSGSALVVLLAT